MTRLSGKVAIVTGGGSGFGAGIVAKFVSEGCKVVVMDIDKSLASQAAAKAPSGSAVAIRGDVSQSEDWVVALDTALVNFGSLDIVVNNAGVLHVAQPSIDMDEHEYDRVMRVNVKQLLWSTKVVVPYLIKNGKSGAFVNVSSMSGVRPRPNLVWKPLFLGHDDSLEAWGKMMSSIPLGRLCQPHDVADAACFLVSDEASFLTGVCLEVDGGRGI
ncbi:uncharacterized protein FOBCDRAFT_198007 [Fusarium oxysporum Fo47]|uniref:uncharacterized protein n=1 Tax=Fusarium oxysporum Fo47 TaxID=660027 RepID=UPI002869C2F3|nr:uncharacterized protein FOBCDRAFT_198007 [Fusarium oxysporum Fo47]WJG34890.1 hypothetical protein FOBCDRAFT_198007 [Fusarium oxysporum Fo47]